MFNGINLSNLNKNENMSVSSVVTNPISNPYRNIDRGLLIDESAISSLALNMYQKEQDIKHFTNLAISNPEDLSHNELVSSLFNKGVIDPLSEEAVNSLLSNNRFLKDIGL